MRVAWTMAVVFALACSKSEGDAPLTDLPPLPSSPLAAPSQAPHPGGSASGAASVPAPPSAPTPAARTTPSASSSAHPADAGDPDYPLRAWMRANVAPAMSSEDTEALASAFDRIATFAPPGYPNWVSISKDGAAAARALSIVGVKGACRGCHEQYKARYKSELRTRALPPSE